MYNSSDGPTLCVCVPVAPEKPLHFGESGLPIIAEQPSTIRQCIVHSRTEDVSKENKSAKFNDMSLFLSSNILGKAVAEIRIR